ncbi:MAG: hypothetical protein RL745_950 [Actinomycetota bacterium]
MKTALESLSPTRVKLTVDLEASDLAPSLDGAYSRIASSINVPGFRKGMVPKRVIDQRVGRMAVVNEALEEAVPRAYDAAIKEHSIFPLAQPSIEVTELSDDESVSFTAEVDIRPDFQLPAYSSLGVTVEPALVAGSQVEDQLDSLRARFATMRAVERPAADGDVLLVNIRGTHDGADVEDLTANALSYELGTEGLLPGFDDAVRGASEGEERSFTFTADGGDWNGQELSVTVTVSAVRERDLPTADDDFAQLASEFDTIEELREDLRSRLSRVRAVEQAYQARDLVLEALVDAVDFPVPEALVESAVEDHFADGHGDGDIDHRAEVTRNARRSLIAQIVLDKVGEVEQVEVSDAEFTQWLINESSRYQMQPQEFADQLIQAGAVPSALAEVRRAKALSLVLEAATVVDTTGAAVDISAVVSTRVGNQPASDASE